MASITVQERLARERRERQQRRTAWNEEQRRAALASLTSAERRALARKRKANVEARAAGKKPKRNTQPRPKTPKSAPKPKRLKVPAGAQALPEDAAERALFRALQRDARKWRDRLAPSMPCDPAQYVHSINGPEPRGDGA